MVAPRTCGAQCAPVRPVRFTDVCQQLLESNGRQDDHPDVEEGPRPVYPRSGEAVEDTDQGQRVEQKQMPQVPTEARAACSNRTRRRRNPTAHSRVMIDNGQYAGDPLDRAGSPLPSNGTWVVPGSPIRSACRLRRWPSVLSKVGLAGSDVAKGIPVLDHLPRTMLNPRAKASTAAKTSSCTPSAMAAHRPDDRGNEEDAEEENQEDARQLMGAPRPPQSRSRRTTRFRSRWWLFPAALTAKTKSPHHQRQPEGLIGHQDGEGSERWRGSVQRRWRCRQPDAAGELLGERVDAEQERDVCDPDDDQTGHPGR